MRKTTLSLFFLLVTSGLIWPTASTANQVQQWLKMAGQAMRAGNTVMAIHNYLKAADSSPKNHKVWYELGIAYYQDKQFKQAARAATKALELAPEKPLLKAKYHSGRAWACFKAGGYAQAVADMDQAARLAPKNPQYRKWLLNARQVQRQKGDGPSLASILNGAEEETETASGSPESSTGGSGEDKVEAGESSGSGDKAAEDESGEEKESGSVAKEEDSEADEGKESASGIPGDLPSQCRKGYYLCLADCSEISRTRPRKICEKACAKAAVSCAD